MQIGNLLLQKENNVRIFGPSKDSINISFFLEEYNKFGNKIKHLKFFNIASSKQNFS